jgi:hypothetical protein
MPVTTELEKGHRQQVGFCTHATVLFVLTYVKNVLTYATKFLRTRRNFYLSQGVMTYPKKF